MEKALNQLGRDLNKRQSQYETSKTCILGLEAKVKEREGTNQILQQIIDAT